MATLAQPPTALPTVASREAEARQLVAGFTVAAAAIGAIPVPGASVAIVAHNSAMIAAIASTMGVPVTLSQVVTGLGSVAAVNTLGRTVFVEGARLLGWFAGPLGVGGVMVLGAATASLQSWSLGHFAIALCRNHGAPLPEVEARRVVEAARREYDVGAWKTAEPIRVRE